MPTNNAHPRYPRIANSRKWWATRHLPSLQYSQRTVINYIKQPPQADGLRNLTLHPHPQRNEWVMGSLVCGKYYDQVIEETVADYLNQTAQPGETVRERQIGRNALIDGIQSGVFTFLPLGESQAAACDGLVYSVNYNGQNSGAQ